MRGVFLLLLHAVAYLGCLFILAGVQYALGSSLSRWEGLHGYPSIFGHLIL